MPQNCLTETSLCLCSTSPSVPIKAFKHVEIGELAFGHESAGILSKFAFLSTNLVSLLLAYEL